MCGWGGDATDESNGKVGEDASSGEPPWLHVTNLRRPFTLPMLKAMLEEHGAITDDEGVYTHSAGQELSHTSMLPGGRRPLYLWSVAGAGGLCCGDTAVCILNAAFGRPSQRVASWVGAPGVGRLGDRRAVSGQPLHHLDMAQPSTMSPWWCSFLSRICMRARSSPLLVTSM